jgi:GNS1/SUR4 family
MSSPLPTLSICLSYVYIVKVLGPKFMENRKPFELRRVLIAYNAFQVLFSTWLFYEVRPKSHFKRVDTRRQIDFGTREINGSPI